MSVEVSFQVEHARKRPIAAIFTAREILAALDLSNLGLSNLGTANLGLTAGRPTNVGLTTDGTTTDGLTLARVLDDSLDLRNGASSNIPVHVILRASGYK